MRVLLYLLVSLFNVWPFRDPYKKIHERFTAEMWDHVKNADPGKLLSLLREYHAGNIPFEDLKKASGPEGEILRWIHNEYEKAGSHKERLAIAALARTLILHAGAGKSIDVSEFRNTYASVADMLKYAHRLDRARRIVERLGRLRIPAFQGVVTYVAESMKASAKEAANAALGEVMLHPKVKEVFED